MSNSPPPPNNQEVSTQAPMILERRDRTASSESTKPALYDPNSPKRNVKLLRSAQFPAIGQEQQQPMKAPRSSVKKQPPSSSSTPLNRQEAASSPSQQQQQVGPSPSCTPFFRRNEQFNVEAITKILTDSPGHYVVGVVGNQGVGKSSILSSFTEQPDVTFAAQPNDLFLSLGHKTSGIDMHVCPERMILLDTEPIMCWTVLEKALRYHSTDGTHPDLWLEMDALYNLVFLLSVCNVVIVVSDGTELDINMIRCLQRAEMLKFQLPDFPLIPPNNLGQAQQDMNYYPDIVFVCNKCQPDDFTLTSKTNVVSDVIWDYQKVLGLLEVYYPPTTKRQMIGTLQISTSYHTLSTFGHHHHHHHHHERTVLKATTMTLKPSEP
ncbi:hypothetical protein [Absidia glauca]|uniref:Protein SMG9 n=1 Tax=Absidia glauca TaxID=4829 RepID=A0A163IXF8_ABSGL|nr:hypothetical protein [Absidia glauca]